VQLYPQNRLFRKTIHISASRGCCAPKFLHAPQNGQVLLAQTPQEMRVPSTFFSKEGPKIGLKCSLLAPRILGSERVTPWNFATWRDIRWALSLIYNIWGTARLKFGKAKKRLKFGAIYDNFQLWPRISQEPVNISKITNKRHWKQYLLRWTKNWTFVHLLKSYTLMLTYQKSTVRASYFEQL